MSNLSLSQAGRTLALVALVIAIAEPTVAQVVEHKLTASDGAMNDFFGYSVSLLGNRALLGAYWDDDSGKDSGSAYAYERQGDGSWLEVVKLTASDGAEGDRFGISVSLSVDRAIVGAFEGMGVHDGAAYVYERQGDGSWIEVAKLTSPDSDAEDAFGFSVSLSGDHAFVSAPEDDDQGTDSGAAYAYERQGDGSWIEVDKLTPSDGTELGLFGFSVALSGDHAFVGAWGDNDFSGSVYVFEWQGDESWLEVDKLNASDGDDGDSFGFSVSLSEDHALVGAVFDEDQGDGSGSAYVYELQGDGSWFEVGKLTASDGAENDFFGYSVSLSETHAIVGAYGNDYMGDRIGSVYVFEQQGDSSWLEMTKLNASDGSAEDLFEFGVAFGGSRPRRCTSGRRPWLEQRLGVCFREYLSGG